MRAARSPSGAGRRSARSRRRWRRGSCGTPASTLCRPVCSRAIRIAFSLASAPPLVKNTWFRSPGASSAISRAASLRASLANAGGIVHSCAGLLLDRGDQLGVLVADVDVDQLGGEVQVALAGVVPEVRARGRGDRQRVDQRLRRPGVEDVRPVVARAPSPRRLGMPARQAVVRRRSCSRSVSAVRGKPRSTVDVAGSGQRVVTTLPRV